MHSRLKRKIISFHYSFYVSYVRYCYNVYMFHASVYSERAMYRSVRIDCSAVASFPCSHCDLRYLNRSLFARQNQLSAHAASSDIAKGRAGFRTSPLQCAMGLVSRTKVQTFPSRPGGLRNGIRVPIYV